jgi:NADH-quinone oxidoreductase subunit G
MSILKNSFVVYLGHHGDTGAHIADVILPTPAFPEKSSTFTNMEGRVLQSTQCFHPIGDSKDEWKIFRALSNEINSSLKFNNLFQLRSEIIKNHQIIRQLNLLPEFNKVDYEFKKKIESKELEFNISNFYMTDSISRASETMAKCTIEILNKAS